MKVLLCPQHLHHCKFMLNIWCSRASNPTVNSLIWPQIQLVQDFIPVRVTCKFHKDLIENLDHHIHNIFSCAQGCVTSRSIEILWLLWLPASLMTIRSKMKALVCPHNFSIISIWEKFSGLKGKYSRPALYNDHLYNGNFDFRWNFFGNRTFLMKIYCIITEFTLSDADGDSRQRNAFLNTFFIH